jgi:ppGpp synthetase/RelA/SpoT-type nucleotidyltranferase
VEDQALYLSVHADIRLKADDPLSANFPPDKFRAEMQVRTLSQNLWAEMAHDTVYKSEDSLRPANKLLQRRIYILAGVVELADEEFNRIEHEMPTVPEFRVLKSLERKCSTRYIPKQRRCLTSALSSSNLKR